MSSNDYSLSDARRAAMDLLARREHSSHELATKLARRFDSELIHDAVSSLQEDGLQCDYRFAEAFVRSRVQKGHGPLKIRNDLSQRRVDSSYFDRIVIELSVNWFDQIVQVLEKKYGTTHFDDQSEQQKAARFLASRGFSGHDIFEILS
ncbi:MAG: regulatory protein RecX [Gammaproteobacteria bacterium]|nr:regulatory protein RecX [Gammaproteobacteria bacterium]